MTRRGGAPVAVGGYTTTAGAVLADRGCGDKPDGEDERRIKNSDREVDRPRSFRDDLGGISRSNQRLMTQALMDVGGHDDVALSMYPRWSGSPVNQRLVPGVPEQGLCD